MSMAHSFWVQGLPLLPPRTPGVDRVTPVGQGAGMSDIRQLLRRLRGREVTLQVGELLRTGRLITVDPVILVGAAGIATMVRYDAILAVDY